MNTPGLFPIVNNRGDSLKRRLQHLLAGARTAPRVGRRWILGACAGTLTAVAGIGFAQQGATPPAPVSKTDGGKFAPAEVSLLVAGNPATRPASTQVARPEGAPQPAPPTKPAANGTKPMTAAASDATSASAAKNGDGPWLIRGTVLRPDGQPAPGAQVVLLRRFWSNRGRWTARAGAKGEFEIRIPRPPYDGLGDGSVWLDARAAGFGAAWVRGRAAIEAAASKPLVLRLVPESPIHGRVVDLEGRPVTGVRVQVREQAMPREGEDLVPWLDAVTKGLTSADSKLGGRLPGYEEETSPPIVSDRDGRFLVRGIGPERVVQLQVRGETIASAQFEVVTRSIKPLATAAGAFRRTQVFGKDFTYQAEPTKPIVGTVRDAVTGQPLAGIRLDLGQYDFIGTQTDAEGKFRLVGVPKATGPDAKLLHWLVAVPEFDQPYFATQVDIPQTTGLEPVTLDIKLKRGLMITGRVTDQVTGKAVQAQLKYFPYASNPFVNKEEWRKLEAVRTRGASQGVTQADGTYHLVGFPGRAIVGATTFTLGYRRGVGASEIPGMTKDGRFPTLGNPMPADAHREYALKEINPAPGAASVACDLALDSSGKLRLTVVDRAGKPVDDSYFVYSSAPAGSTMHGWPSEATFDVEGLAPKESRTFVIAQAQRKIAKLFTLAYDDKPARELTITLEPCATVRGRLVDEDGSPVKNLGIRASATRDGRAVLELSPLATETDADGRFECNLAGGCDTYEIYADDPGRRGFVTVAEKVTFSPGKTIDLGEVRINRDGSKALNSADKTSQTSAPKTQTPHATKPQAAPAASRGSVFSDETPRIIRGTVLRPDGKPAAGAQLLALRRFWSGRGNWRPLATARAGAHGEFEIRVPRQPYDGLGSGFGWLAARAEGFGVQWARGREALEAKPLVLKLVSESPIHGRIVDLEGSPIRGVRVTVREQQEPQEGQDLASWLSAVKSGSTRWRRGLGDLLPGFVDASEPPITTSQDGQFTLSGIGAERVVQLRLDGDAIASTEFEVVTRPSEPITRSEGPAGPGQVFGNNFTYQAEPTKPVVGTVRDAVTGRPLPGIGVESDLRVFIRTKTDPQGRFQLLGMPKAAGSARRDRNQIRVMPADDQPYFPDLKDVPQTPGLDPVVIDVKLRRGLWVTGRVTEKGTDKPAVARMGYSPFLSNAFAAQVPWFQRNTSSIYDIMHSVSQSDGTFRLLVLPGRGIVSATGLSQSYRAGVGANEIGGMNKDGIFPTYRNSSTASAKHDHALKEINPSEGGAIGDLRSRAGSRRTRSDHAGRSRA